MQKDNLNNEELQFNNELMKLKLNAEYGAQTYYGNLPPHIENRFLNDIFTLHEQCSNCGQISVYEYLGCPQHVSVYELDEAELYMELDRITNIMAENMLFVEFLYLDDMREKYRFITEELFEHEIDNVRLKGFSSHFIYEEFHPNNIEDMKLASKTILSQFFKKGSEHFPPNAEFRLSPGGTEFTLRELIEKCAAFRDSYSDIRVDSITFDETVYDGNSYVFPFLINYSAVPDGTDEVMKLSVNGKIGFTRDNIFMLTLPGILPE